MTLTKSRISFVAASGQNVFFEDLEQTVTAALRSLGFEVGRVVDHFPDPEPHEIFLFVPHEYYGLTAEEAHPTEYHLARTIVLATEQPGTPWFEISREICERAAAVVDINQAGARALREHGIDAEHLPLAYVPEWDAWQGDQDSPRPVDVLFLGGRTERRELALALCGDVLARHECHIRLVDTAVPLLRDAPGVESGHALRRRFATSKVLLNVHRSDQAYFEWHRALMAIVNGCVVVTDHAADLGVLRPGSDLLCTTLESMPHVLEAVLENDALRRSIQQSALSRVRAELQIQRLAAVLGRAVEQVLSRFAAEPIRGARTSVPRPRNPPRRKTGWERAQEHTDPTKLGIKMLLRGQRELFRRIEQLEATGPDPAPLERTFGPYDQVVPEVSVVLTVFNYESLVEEAIQSVSRATHDRYELVVIDDGSRDNSVEVVMAALERRPWLPAKLVSLSRNVGLPSARNLGARHSRGDLVFMLDADNSIYPRCLELLARPLREDPSLAFAYGIIERYEPSGAAGLVSWQPWDPEELRYDNFIDAMAMLRRSALLGAGGYTTDSRLYGWEDYELWCRLVDMGHTGVQVPNIVARYRSGRFSMLSITNLDTYDAWSALVERYPWLAVESAEAVVIPRAR